MDKLIIIGAGGHGKVVADIALKLGKYEEIVFLDDGNISDCLGLKVVGKTGQAEKNVGNAEIFVAIGNDKIREEFVKKLLSVGAILPTLIHPSAIIGANVQIGEGSVVMAGAVINPCAVIGKGCIVNTCASVDHDCLVGDFSHVSVGARIAGTVSVGQRVFIGAGAVVKNNVKVCDNCVIGAGAVVVKDIFEKATYIGTPAKKLR